MSKATAQAGDLQVKYERFERLFSTGQIEIQLGEQSVKKGEVRLQIDQSLLDSFTIQRIMPEPDSQELSADSQTYVFKVGEAGNQMNITIALQPSKTGAVKGNISTGTGQTVTLSQFIYP